MSEKYNKFVNNDKMYSWAANIQRVKKENEAMIEYYKEEALETGLKEGHAQGHAQGLVEGRTEGRVEGLKEGLIGLINYMYHVDGSEWLDSLSLEQLEKINSKIFSCKTFKDLKNTIE